MLIRPIGQEDIEGITAIERDNLSPWSQSLIESELCYPSGIQLLACNPESSKIMGWCCARFLEPEAELLKIATSKIHRRKGIATNLLEELFSICRKEHCSRIFLEVREKNFAALTLYQNLGFIQHSRREKYFQAPEDNCLILVKHLVASEE